MGCNGTGQLIHFPCRRVASKSVGTERVKTLAMALASFEIVCSRRVHHGAARTPRASPFLSRQSLPGPFFPSFFLPSFLPFSSPSSPPVPAPPTPSRAVEKQIRPEDKQSVVVARCACMSTSTRPSSAAPRARARRPRKNDSGVGVLVWLARLVRHRRARASEARTNQAAARRPILFVAFPI